MTDDTINKAKTEKSEKTGVEKKKRPSKGERTHVRRLKQEARKSATVHN